MVSQDSSSNQDTSMVHQFIISETITGQNQFENHNFSAYTSDLRVNNNTFPHSLGALPSIHSLGERMSTSIDQESEISHTRHLMDLLGAANEANHQAQRLSLSLGPRMLVPQVQYRQRSFDLDLLSPGYLIPGERAKESCNLEVEQVNNDYCLTGSGYIPSFAVAIKNSKYLKPAQLLLEEIVSVSGKAVNISNEKYFRKLFRGGRREALGLSAELKAELYGNGFLSAEKQEIQVKIAKLVELLEEVESRYEKYYHQMEEVVVSFEEIAGLRAANSYTGLALQAMSRHFCSLREAIVSQIHIETRKIVQDLPKISMGLSQLSLFDRESRHNRIPLQQLGMIQCQRQAWRPIRGLPETSVAILRSWLFEHFLHPYPNDSEKLMLASQTGLTKNQVSNWFINARVRLWKPMIEEMYKEEFAETAEDSDQVLVGSCSSMTKDGITDHSENLEE